MKQAKLLLITSLCAASLYCQAGGRLPAKAAKPSTTSGGVQLQTMYGNRTNISTQGPYVSFKCDNKNNKVCLYRKPSAMEENSECGLRPAPIPPQWRETLDPEKSYIGLPNPDGGVAFYEVRSSRISCNDEGFQVTAETSPDLVIE